MDSGFQVLDSGFINVMSVDLGYQIPWAVFWTLTSKIPNSTRENFQDSGSSTYFLLASIEHLSNFFITARPAYLIVHICTQWAWSIVQYPHIRLKGRKISQKYLFLFIPLLSNVGAESWPRMEMVSLRASSPGCSGGGRELKESLQLLLWNLNICIEKLNAKCLLLTFALVSTWHWLVGIWQLSPRGPTGELEVEFKFQRCSCKLSFLFPPCHQSAPESLLTG